MTWSSTNTRESWSAGGAAARVVAESDAARLEIRAPERLAVGSGSAFVLAGHCYDVDERTRGLAVRIGGSTQQVERFGLPRDDVYASLAAGDPARPHAYRSGFVALVDVRPLDRPAALELELIMSLADGSKREISLGSVHAEPKLIPPGDAPAPVFPGPLRPARRDLHGDL